MFTSFNFSIGANSAHRECCDDAHDSWDPDDEQGQSHACLWDHPRYPEEEHHAPDVEETWYEDTLETTLVKHALRAHCQRLTS